MGVVEGFFICCNLLKEVYWRLHSEVRKGCESRLYLTDGPHLGEKMQDMFFRPQGA